MNRRTFTRTKVMGVVNTTPDSFSDGGRFVDADAALAHALRLIDDGADILDIGGESTRPGAAPVSQAEEIERTASLIAAIRMRSHIPISIDTMKPDVARAAVFAGASLWNDVTALSWSPESLPTAVELGCTVILMHMRGDPRSMQASPTYGDVVGEVEGYLLSRAEAALAAGVTREAIWIDPGLGFGKTLSHNLALLAALPRLVATGLPVLLGASRKSFIGKLHATAATDRLGGSIAAALTGHKAGVAAVRVHDVRETVQALIVQEAISAAVQTL